MSMERAGKAGGGAFVIARSGPLDLRNASELRDEIRGALEGNGSVTIDATEVTAVDTGIVQVLLAARRSADQAGRRFTIIAGAGSALPDTVSRLGIAPLHT
jgi:anti-anti-sigma regulatory factor